MSKQTALILLDELEKTLEGSKSIAASGRLEAYYKRDVQFIEEARACLNSDDPQKVRWLFDQMRNLSQGFGSYCPNLKKLDLTLDRLFAELQDTLIKCREEG